VSLSAKAGTNAVVEGSEGGFRMSVFDLARIVDVWA